MAEAHIVAIGDPPCLSRWLDQAEADRLAATLRQSFPGALVTSKAVENTLFSAGEAERAGVPQRSIQGTEMKMDRNITANRGGGKYAIVNMREFRALDAQQRAHAKAMLDALHTMGLLDYGSVGTPGEFFLVKLKDKHALPTLKAYADSIRSTDSEFASEVADMALRSGPYSPWCKEPD